MSIATYMTQCPNKRPVNGPVAAGPHEMICLLGACHKMLLIGGGGGLSLGMEGGNL